MAVLRNILCVNLAFPHPLTFTFLSTFHFFCVIARPCGFLDNGINDSRARGGAQVRGVFGVGIVISRMNFFFTP